MTAPRPLGIGNPPQCDYCGCAAALVTGAELYPELPRLADRRYWLCRLCEAWCAAAENSVRYAPAGTLANAELRALRRGVHAELRELVAATGMTRRQAYDWLRDRMGETRNRWHVGYLRDGQCFAASVIIAQRMAQERMKNADKARK